MDNIPNISVIVPVYQVKDYISECVDSIISQDYKDIEIILVDDGSYDGGGDVCDLYEKSDSRVKVIHKENGGLSDARNVGIEKARGRYFAFVDGDDVVDNRFLSRLYEISIQYDCDICQCDFYNTTGKSLLKDSVSGIPVFYNSREFVYSAYNMYSWNCTVVWNKLYKRSLFEDIRFPVGRLHEDEFITYLIAEKANRIAVIPDKLYYYRHRPTSIMHEVNEKKWIDADVAMTEKERHYELIGDLELKNNATKRHLWFIKECLRKNIAGNIAEMFYAKKSELEEKISLFDNTTESYSQSNFVFPFSQIEKSQNILLYGAGCVGRSYYMQIMATNYCRVLYWVDERAECLKKVGYPVCKPEKVSDWSLPEKIVVAINDWRIADEIIKYIEESYRVDRNRIVFSIKGVMNAKDL